MPRVKRGVTAHRRHKKILKKAKGYYGARSRVFRVAKQAVTKAGQYAYRDRRQRKRQFRSLWITRINAQSRANGLTYSRLVSGLKLANVALDRRVLADLAVHDKEAFAEVVAVEPVDVLPHLLHDLLLERLGDRALAAPRQPREPQRHALLTDGLVPARSGG